MHFKTSIFSAFLLSVFCFTTAIAQTPQSPQVQIFLQQASQAGALLEAGDLAGIESTLEPGFNEIALMMSNYRSDEQTNTYLRQRGWGHLVWTQLMYRLLAIRDGVYDHEMEFAERVAVEEVAKSSLQTVQISYTRLQVLLAAVDKMDLDTEITRFAQTILDDGSGPVAYRTLVTDFAGRFAVRRKAVMVRLATGIHRSIVDPADLPHGTEYAQAYAEHRRRLAGENRMDEVLSGMAAADEQKIQRLAQLVQHAADPAAQDAARNELKLQLLLVEDSLDAYDHDPSVANMVQFFAGVEVSGYLHYTSYPDDIQTVMALVQTAERNMKQQSQPARLRGIYTIAELVR